MTEYNRMESTDLQRADIRGIDLRGADLRDADLRDTNMRGAMLDGAKLDGEDERAELRERIEELESENAWLVEDLADERGGEAPVVTVDTSALPRGAVVYLASPYTHEDAEVVATRYRVTRAATAAMLRAGVHVYSPIVHCHALARVHALPTDAGFWRAYNHAMIERCDVVAVLTIDGWRESEGVAGECAHAQTCGLDVVHVEVAQ